MGWERVNWARYSASRKKGVSFMGFIWKNRELSASVFWGVKIPEFTILREIEVI
jgi:hypothetical protein